MILNSLKNLSVKSKVVTLSGMGENGDDAQVIIRRQTVADEIRFRRLLAPYFDKDPDSENPIPQDDYIQMKICCCMVNKDGQYVVPNDEEVLNLQYVFDTENFGKLIDAVMEMNPPPTEADTLDAVK